MGAASGKQRMPVEGLQLLLGDQPLWGQQNQLAVVIGRARGRPIVLGIWMVWIVNGFIKAGISRLAALAQTVDVELGAGKGVFDAFDFPILMGVYLLGRRVELQSPQIIAVGDF